MIDVRTHAPCFALVLLSSVCGTGAFSAIGAVHDTLGGPIADPRFVPAAADSVATNERSIWIVRFWNTIKSWADEEQEQTRIETISRDSESLRLSIPLLSSLTPQTLVAGTRSFHLTWIGGSQPFSVVLTGPPGTQEVRWQAGEKRAVTGTIRLEEGSYEVRITDADGGRVLGGFDASSALPALNQRQVDSLPADIRNAMSAALLAGMDDGAWCLEAYERLVAEPKDWAAQVVANRLLQGQPLSDLQELVPAGP